MGDEPAADERKASRFVAAPPEPVPVTDPGGVLVLGPHRATGAGRLPIAVYGGGGHGAQCIDLLRGLDGPEPDCVLDDSLAVGSDVLGVEVLGGSGALADLAERGVRVAVNAVGGIASPAARARVFDLLTDAGLTLPVIVHVSASIEPSALVGPGAQVFAQAYVGTRVVIGAGSLLNAGVVVSHDCVLDAGANVSPGALLAGGVHVGRLARIGMGATVNVGLRVGAGARIGNGATVKADVPDEGVVRAGHIWPE
jgi:acetyltransferase EpsM